MSDKLVKTKSPLGELEWCTINGEGKENLNGDMQYVANVVLDPKNKEHKAYIASIDQFWKDNKPKGAKAAAKSLGYYDHTERTDETDEDGKPEYAETGKIVVRFKTATTYKDGKPKRIQILNAKGKPVAVDEDFSIGNGSIGILHGAMDIYTLKTKEAGVTFYLDAVQLKKHEEYSGGVEGEDISDDDEDDWSGEDFTGDSSDEGGKVRL